MKAWTTEPAGAKGLQPSVQPSEEAAGLPKGYSPAGPRLGGTAAGMRGQRLWRGGMPRVDCSGRAVCGKTACTVLRERGLETEPQP